MTISFTHVQEQQPETIKLVAFKDMRNGQVYTSCHYVHIGQRIQIAMYTSTQEDISMYTGVH